MSLAGAMNGTDVALAVEAVPEGGTFGVIAGIVSNSTTFNNGAIDITNKSSASFREIMAGEGLQTLDISGEFVFSSDLNFEIMRTSYLEKSILLYRIPRGTEVLQFAAYITSWSESSPDNDKHTVSISMQSSGPITDAVVAP